MALPVEDTEYLAERGIVYEVREEGGMICLLFPGWPLPAGLNASSVDVLIRLAPGYPDIPPDMWWVDPPLRDAAGIEIPATQSMESHLGRTWQRWSRHFSAGQWQAGIDRLSGFLALMVSEFRKAGAATG